MAEPGDPDHPDAAAEPAAPAGEPGRAAAPSDPGADWDDDHIGFASPASLTPKPVRPPEPEPEPQPEPAPIAETPEPEPDLFEPAAPIDEVQEPARPAPTPGWAVETPMPDKTPPNVAGAMNLYANYALILFAVPTLGVSAIIGLLAVTGREPPADPVARSHFIYQQRTLWAAGVVALLGVILVVVNIGVFVLFLVACWTLIRGALGVFRLKAGQPIPDPRHWLI